MKRNYSEDLANGTLNEDEVVDSSEIYGGMINRITNTEDDPDSLFGDDYEDEDVSELNFDRE